MTLQIERRLFTVAEYDQMIAAGIFTEQERVELIAGEIVRMSPISMRHAACVTRLTHLLVASLAEQALVSVQNPVQLNNHSEPEPDLAILQPRDDFYENGRPTPTDIFLLIEVAETSLAYDRQQKVPLYAKAGIPEVWIVNTEANQVEMYRQPTPDGYQTQSIANTTQTIAPEAFPQTAVSVARIFGKA